MHHIDDLIVTIMFSIMIMCSLIMVVTALIFIWLFRKYSPPTEEVKKLKFFLVFLCGLVIPILSIVIVLIALGIITAFKDDNLLQLVLSIQAIFYGGVLVLLVGGIPAIFTAFISLLLRLYIFKKNQMPWFISTVLVGFFTPVIPLIFILVGRLTALGVPSSEMIKEAMLHRYTLDDMLIIFSLPCIGALCSFCSALVLTGFSKSKQENNE